MIYTYIYICLHAYLNIIYYKILKENIYNDDLFSNLIFGKF